ncbi:programmed cell death 1 ligand 1-like [Thalassophryne amazonica]|uniref:programmed cell death 1 ligand 1-like n=1 Tax=Thalassophryne amazonica TaxID=390379 RepID=UPI0014715402|nr:programmed cell death 1 ligand 1-like [Thalassophryne amazonica]
MKPLLGWLLLFYVCLLVLQLPRSSGTTACNGTRDKDLLWRCHYDLTEEFKPNHTKIYWQGQSSVLVFYNNGVITKDKDKFKERVEIFPEQLKHGNFSLRINPLKLDDDNTSLEVIFKANLQPKIGMCQVTVYVAARFEEPNIQINESEKMATCSTKGGYPKPQITWTTTDSKHSFSLPEQGISSVPAENGTLDISSTVSINGIQSVTCDVFNPTSKETRTATKIISGSSPLHPGAIAIIVIILVVGILCVLCLTVRKRPQWFSWCPGLGCFFQNPNANEAYQPAQQERT